jgi:hypothetical protein
MLDRFERPLRWLCVALAAALVFQLARLALRGDPLAHLSIPELPALAAGTNAPGTNAVKGLAAGTNAPGTNSPQGTNTVKATNIVQGTNLASGNVKTNGTNTLAATTNGLGTNLVQSTNLVQATNQVNRTNGTNMTNMTNALAGQTNAAPRGRRGSARSGQPDGMAGMMMPGGMMGGGPPRVVLPPPIQNRVDKITDSEIFGQVMHPQPVALIGIADHDAFIRSPEGQIGLVKVGGELGGIKLLRTSINRALIEQDGEKKELTIFNGAGSESLMPKNSEASTNPPSQTNSLNLTNSLSQTNSPSKTNKTLLSKPKETN